MTTGLKFKIAQEIKPKHLSKLVHNGTIKSEHLDTIVDCINDTTFYLAGIRDTDNKQAMDTLKQFISREEVRGRVLIEKLYARSITMNTESEIIVKFVPIKKDYTATELSLNGERTDIYLRKYADGKYSIYSMSEDK